MEGMTFVSKIISGIFFRKGKKDFNKRKIQPFFIFFNFYSDFTFFSNLTQIIGQFQQIKTLMTLE